MTTKPLTVVLHLLLFCLISYAGTAQTFLALDNTHRLKRFRFYPNEEIRIKFQEEHRFMRYNLDGFHGDSLVLSNQYTLIPLKIPLGYVRKIYVPKPDGLTHVSQLLGNLALVTGLAVLTVRAINSSSYHGQVFSNGYLYPYGGMILGGFALAHGSRHRYRVGKNWQLKVVDLGLKEPANPEYRPIQPPQGGY